MFKATTEKHDGIARILLSGEIDSATAPQLESHLEEVLKSGDTRLIVDFTNLAFISSAGLRVLLSYAKKVKKAQGRITLAGMSPAVHNVFESVGFASIFSIYSTAAEAIAAMTTPGGKNS